MKVIIYDTSAIVSSGFLMNDLDFLNTIKSNADLMDLYVYFPQIVIDESLNKLKEFIRKTNKELSSSFGNIFSIIKEIKKDAEQLKNGYISEENERKSIDLFNSQINKIGKTIPYPKVPHSNIVERALSRKKPFDEKGHNGYRDTLIWENIKELLQDKKIEEVIFICNNPVDFFDTELYKKNDIRLNLDLSDELNSLKLQDKLFCCKNLSDVYKTKIEPELKSIQQEYKNEACRFMKTEKFKTMLKPYIHESLFDENDFLEFLNFPHDSVDIMYIGLSMVENISDAKEIENNIGAFVLECDIDFSLDVYIYKWDWEEDMGYLEDWNESYFLKEIAENKSFKFIVQLNYVNEEIISVNKMNETENNV